MDDLSRSCCQNSDCPTTADAGAKTFRYPMLKGAVENHIETCGKQVVLSGQHVPHLEVQIRAGTPSRHPSVVQLSARVRSLVRFLTLQALGRRSRIAEGGVGQWSTSRP